MNRLTQNANTPMTSRMHLSSCAVVLLWLLAASGCGLLDPADDFIILVDSITAPATIARDDTLHVQFHGIIGPNLCYRLEHVDRRRTVDSLIIRFGGTRPGGTRDCLEMVAMLAYQDNCGFSEF